MSKCFLCPRKCGVDRSCGELGFCGEGNEIRIARYSLHMWEETPISGKRGSGTIFFSGCSLRCEFCQNRAISHSGGIGEAVSEEELSQIMLSLEKMGAENINLVTPTHFADKIARSLKAVRQELKVPVVYNTSGYENVETLKLFDGLVDIYLPDFKYFSDELAIKYSSAPNYREVAQSALAEMSRQVGKVTFDNEGMLQKGMLIRHLVLPSHRHDSMEILRLISKTFNPDEILISIMSQYTPEFAIKANSVHRELHRKITSFEYNSVLNLASELGLVGFCQKRTSATSDFTPNF